MAEAEWGMDKPEYAEGPKGKKSFHMMIVYGSNCTGGKWASEVVQIRVDRCALSRPCPGSRMETGQPWGGEQAGPNSFGARPLERECV
ncbi:hypothetical protein N7478_003471 [Penicillium angulare]|uniref:uncharacterized protein n=1 Tax=Penicillium angulare TaxID=116970 RepID=UPI00253FEDC6|nr:uncharacterized protein N7478_003471 [Penicillium angulare]KAJ5287785.1 hypothetical protein N7478_003471 [Penicillium angulare]